MILNYDAIIYYDSSFIFPVSFILFLVSFVATHQFFQTHGLQTALGMGMGTHGCVCEKQHFSKEETLGKMSFQSIKSEAGE